MSYFLSYCKAHGGALLTGYQALRAEGFLCDVTLEAEGSEFPAHRSLLACASDYFRALFKSHTRESRASVIHLHVPSAAGLQRLLDFIYTAWLPLSMDTVEDTLEAASYLQVTEALGLCGRYLERQLAPDNCCFAANVAARFGLLHTLGAAERCIARHLRELLLRGAGPAGLLELNPTSLKALLGAPDLARVPESWLLGLALAWLRQEPEAERLAHCASLLERVRFGLVPADVLRRVYSGSGLDLPARVKGLIIQALNYHRAPSRQPLLQGEQTSVRSPQTRILLVGGRRAREAVAEEVVVPQRVARGRGAAPEPQEEEEEEEEEEQVEEEEDWELTQDVLAFDVYNHRWRSLTRLPAPLLGHSVCTAGNFLFVLGGESPPEAASSPPADGPRPVTAEVHRYDPRFHAWTALPAMREARAHFWCGAVGEGLLAVGGLGADGQALASVEMYDLRRDRWTAAAALPRALHGHAGAVGDRGVVYISGGKAGSGEGGASSLRDVYALGPGERAWSKRAPMSTARFGHHMAVLRGAVFAFLGRYEPFSEIERYDPGTDQWTRLRPLPYDRFCYGLAVVEETALLLGGLKWRESRQVPTRNVVGYDLDLDRWEDIGCALPWAWSGLQCAVLQLAEGGDEEREGGRAGAPDLVLGLMG
ncbi:kelch-like protein 34 [Canis lupus familiaris]|uniref:kelch-like protein 34 n=1 Tax=Canis lupus dingo TaxID=286419 RepID=UPI000DC6B540|nr:kelch-like protein 34 [Canis lupus dingo]XP_038442979.1 kelch-like protein 34 [Canis lupus familiaris]